jgi:hypothetical protein
MLSAVSRYAEGIIVHLARSSETDSNVGAWTQLRVRKALIQDRFDAGQTLAHERNY